MGRINTHTPNQTNSILTCPKARDVGFECAINKDLDSVGQSAAGRNPEREDVEGVDVEVEHGLFDTGVIIAAYEAGAWSAAASCSTETSAARTSRGGAYCSPCVILPRPGAQAVERLQVAIIKTAADQQVGSSLIACLFRNRARWRWGRWLRRQRTRRRVLEGYRGSRGGGARERWARGSRGGWGRRRRRRETRARGSRGRWGRTIVTTAIRDDETS